MAVAELEFGLFLKNSDHATAGQWMILTWLTVERYLDLLEKNFVVNKRSRKIDYGAMIRRDWSIKPVFHAYRDLVFNQWWTRESTATNTAGEAVIRAFHGRHQITVSFDDRQPVVRRMELGADGRTLHVIFPGEPVGGR